jgi:hypothetical protein
LNFFLVQNFTAAKPSGSPSGAGLFSSLTSDNHRRGDDRG